MCSLNSTHINLYVGVDVEPPHCPSEIVQSDMITGLLVGTPNHGRPKSIKVSRFTLMVVLVNVLSFGSVIKSLLWLRARFMESKKEKFPSDVKAFWLFLSGVVVASKVNSIYM